MNFLPHSLLDNIEYMLNKKDGLYTSIVVTISYYRKYLEPLVYPRCVIFIKNLNFVEKSQFWAEISMLVRNLNSVQKSQFWSKK